MCQFGGRPAGPATTRRAARAPGKEGRDRDQARLRSQTRGGPQGAARPRRALRPGQGWLGSGPWARAARPIQLPSLSLLFPTKTTCIGSLLAWCAKLVGGGSDFLEIWKPQRRRRIHSLALFIRIEMQRYTFHKINNMFLQRIR